MRRARPTTVSRRDVHPRHLAAGAGAPHDRVGAHPSRCRRVPPVGTHRVPRTVAGQCRRHTPQRIGQLRKQPIERRAERLATVPAQQKRYHVRGRVVHEALHSAVALHGRPLHHERSPRIGRLSAGKLRRGQAPSLRTGDERIANGRARHHRKVGAHVAATARELRLVVHRQSLFHPTRRERIGKEQGIPAKHRAPHHPRPTRAIDLEDVRHLMRDHHAQPVVVKAQLALRDRWNGIDHHAIRGKHLRVPVAGVHVVDNEQIYRTRRRCELARQLRIRHLRQQRRASRQRLLVGAEVHAKMRHGDGTHRPPRIDLRHGRRGERQQHAERGDEHDREPRAGTFPRAGHAPHTHHGCSTGVKIRKYRSSPTTSPSAYFRWKPASRMAASCSGSMRNNPSASTDGYHVGRATARFW